MTPDQPPAKKPISPVPPEPIAEAVLGDPAQPPTKFEIGEEFGTAKKNLPPTKIILTGVGLILVVAAIVALVQKPKTQAIGTIDAAVAAEIPGQNSVMAAINISVENQGKEEFKIHNIKVEIETASGTQSDEPAPAMDLDRYYQALPELRKRALDPIANENVIAPGATTRGTIVVTFPITPDAFNNRKSLKVTVWPYRATVPLILMK